MRIWQVSLSIAIALKTIAVVSADDNLPDNNNSKIEEAIRLCREKLSVDPHFPKIQLSLAQLLDSKISDDYPDEAMVSEVIELYYTVGNPSTEVETSRLPPQHVRFDSLVRAGTLAKDVLHDSSMATLNFLAAFGVEGIEESSLVALFEVVMPLLLSTVQEGRGETTIDPTGSINVSSSEKTLQKAMEICQLMSSKCPDEPIVDEYKGATLRKMQKMPLAFHSYKQAMVKARNNYLSCNDSTNHSTCISQLGTLLRTSILVSASSREVGAGPEEQMKYLEEAETYLKPLLEARFGKEDDSLFEVILEHCVELYNNMGIVEKKRGDFARAREFFMKALEVRADDGHALVQLASLEGGNGDDIVSKATRLDPDYVSALFDGYSSRFESELVDVLQYRGHALLFNELVTAWETLKISLSSIRTIVDLGSGTGLLGEQIANEMPWVAVHGVDLSQRMTDISRQRKSRSGTNVYASVINGGAVEFLSTLENQSVDSIVASDVFIYIGDISTLLEESARCIVQNGLVGFTVEVYEGRSDNVGLKLLPNGRFGYSKSYIDDIAISKGFEVLSWNNCVLRQGGGNDVEGAVVILRRK
eukprot:scaffold743_cov117-Cylindrotheca_fusiformis.AAC.25